MPDEQLECYWCGRVIEHECDCAGYQREVVATDRDMEESE